MPIFEITSEAIVPVSPATFASQSIRERSLQRLLPTQIEAILPDTYVLAEEYGDWEDSRRRIDLLCLDKEANLVVVELKRTEDGGHMELQAIRYAAMISSMRFEQAVEAHSQYRLKLGKQDDPKEAILRFLEWDEPHDNEFGKHVRIVLVAAEFSKEITSSVLWLNDHELDIRCVRLRPYAFGERTLLDIQQIIPLPEAVEYQVQMRKKVADERKVDQVGTSDWTRYDVTIKGKLEANVYKRRLFLAAVRGLIESGVTVAEINEYLPERKFIGIPGSLSAEEFQHNVALLKRPDGSPYDLRRFFLEDGELFQSDGVTYAMSNQWSRYELPTLEELIKNYPTAAISYRVTSGGKLE